MTDRLTDTQLAVQLARKAGEIALALRAEGRLQGRALGDAGDKTANAFLIPAIREHRPDDAILSEESEDSDARLGQSRVWIIDPVDGTRQFVKGSPDHAVMVAEVRGGQVVRSWIHQPQHARSYVAERSAGAPTVAAQETTSDAPQFSAVLK